MELTAFTLIGPGPTDYKPEQLLGRAAPARGLTPLPPWQFGSEEECWKGAWKQRRGNRTAVLVAGVRQFAR